MLTTSVQINFGRVINKIFIVCLTLLVSLILESAVTDEIVPFEVIRSISESIATRNRTTIVSPDDDKILHMSSPSLSFSEMSSWTRESSAVTRLADLQKYKAIRSLESLIWIRKDHQRNNSLPGCRRALRYSLIASSQ